MELSDFDLWNESKKRIDLNMTHWRVEPRGIYWCYIGRNIGTEISCTSPEFSRPVYILSILPNNLALTVPCTSAKQEGAWFFKVKIRGKDQVLCLNHIKSISTKRMYKLIDKLSNLQHKEIVKNLCDLLNDKPPK